MRLPSGTSRTVGFAVAAAACVLGAARCSDDDGSGVDEAVDDVVDTITTEGQEAVGDALNVATETAIRNIATEHGEDQFEEAGHPIGDGGLTCDASVASGGLDAVHVECTGTTEDGADATLTGRTSEFPTGMITEIDGEFSGTVAGDEVFATQQLDD